MNVYNLIQHTNPENEKKKFYQLDLTPEIIEFIKGNSSSTSILLNGDESHGQLIVGNNSKKQFHLSKIDFKYKCLKFGHKEDNNNANLNSYSLPVHWRFRVINASFSLNDDGKPAVKNEAFFKDKPARTAIMLDNIASQAIMKQSKQARHTNSSSTKKSNKVIHSSYSFTSSTMMTTATSTTLNGTKNTSSHSEKKLNLTSYTVDDTPGFTKSVKSSRIERHRSLTPNSPNLGNSRSSLPPQNNMNYVLHDPSSLSSSSSNNFTSATKITLRKKLLHLLALSPMDIQSISAKLPHSDADIQQELLKIANPIQGKYQILPEAYLEVHPYEWHAYTFRDKESVIKRANEALDILGIPVAERKNLHLAMSSSSSNLPSVFTSSPRPRSSSVNNVPHHLGPSNQNHADNLDDWQHVHQTKKELNGNHNGSPSLKLKRSLHASSRSPPPPLQQTNDTKSLKKRLRTSDILSETEAPYSRRKSIVEVPHKIFIDNRRLYDKISDISYIIDDWLKSQKKLEGPLSEQQLSSLKAKFSKAGFHGNGEPSIDINSSDYLDYLNNLVDRYLRNH